MSTNNRPTDTAERHPPISIPPGGFRTNEDEARWLEQTVLMRTREMIGMLGISVEIKPTGLYDLFLLSLNKASKRSIKNG